MNEAGTIGENKFAEYLIAQGYQIEKAPPVKFYDWDIRATKPERRPLTFEVKYDEKAYYWAERRGTPDNPNIYIEYRNTNQNENSGILASKAEYYVYILKSEQDIAYVFNRLNLCDHLLASSYRTAGNSATGDNNALGWIPPLKEVIKHRSFICQIPI